MMATILTSGPYSRYSLILDIELLEYYSKVACRNQDLGGISLY